MNKKLVEHALLGIEVEIQELTKLRATYINWLNGEDGYGHLPQQPPTRKARTCKICGLVGHNKRTCKRRKK